MVVVICKKKKKKERTVAERKMEKEKHVGREVMGFIKDMGCGPHN